MAEFNFVQDTKIFPTQYRRLKWIDEFTLLRYNNEHCIEDWHYTDPDDGDPWNGAWVSLNPASDSEECEKEFRKLGLIVIHSTPYGLSIEH